MKGKGGPSFFDVLRTTMSRELGDEPEATEPKARPAVLEAVPTPKPARVAAPRTPAPPPPAAPPPVPPRPALKAPAPGAPAAPPTPDDPDVPSLTISHTTAVFVLLVGLLGLLGAFYFGIRVGKRSPADAAAAPTEVRAPVAPIIDESPQVAAPAATQAPARTTESAPKWTIRVMEWSGATPNQRQQGEKLAEYMQRFLAERGFPGAEIGVANNRVVLTYGRFASRDAADARKALDDLRAVQYSTRSGPPRKIFQGADFVSSSR